VPHLFGQQVMAFRSVGAIDLVVGGHDGPGFGLFHGNFETLQVNFAQGPLAHDGVDRHAVGLRVVSGEVLDGCSDSVRLDALHHSGRSFACHQWIFGVIFEVTSAKALLWDSQQTGRAQNRRGT